MNEARIHLRLPTDIAEWVKDYAKRNRTTVSEVVRRLLVEEQKREIQFQEAEQI